MPGNFLIAEEYGRLLGQFAAEVAPCSGLPSAGPTGEPFDPLRLRPVTDVTSFVDKLLGMPSEVPIEWRMGQYWATHARDLLTGRALGSGTIDEALGVMLQHHGMLCNSRTISHSSRSDGGLAETHHGEHVEDPTLGFLFRSILAAKIYQLFNSYSGSDRQHQVDLRADCLGSLMQRFDRELDFIDIDFRERDITFSVGTDVLNQKLGDADGRMICSLDRELRRRLADLPVTGKWQDRIKFHIRSNHLSEVSLDEICDTFRVQRRTLARMLRDEGTTFTNILTDLRREKALHLVKHTGVPLKRVASELGFNSDASFNMAFKSWTGTTPMKFRKSASARPVAAHPQPVELALAVEPRRSLRSGLLLSSWSTRANA